MTTTKKLIGSAAVAGGVALGSIAGALWGAPMTSSAQEGTTSTVEQPADQGPPNGGPGGRGGPRFGGFDLSVAAEAIGISEDDLRTALQDGQSIAEVATANGVDPQTVIDTLVAAANARLDEAVAAGDVDEERAAEIREGLVERITAHVNGEGGFGQGGPGGPGHRGFRDLALVAETIGIEEDALRTALEDGQTIAEVATANGVDPQTVIDALVAEATERITARVNGTD